MGSSAPLWAEFDQTLEMVAQMEAGPEQSAPVPAPLDDWPKWLNDVRAYYPDGEGRLYEMHFVFALLVESDMAEAMMAVVEPDMA